MEKTITTICDMTDELRLALKLECDYETAKRLGTLKEFNEAKNIIKYYNRIYKKTHRFYKSKIDSFEDNDIKKQWFKGLFMCLLFCGLNQLIFFVSISAAFLFISTVTEKPFDINDSITCWCIVMILNLGKSIFKEFFRK